MQRLTRLVTPLLVVILSALIAWWATRLMPGTPIAVPPTAANEGNAGGGRVDAVLASARLFGSRRPGVLSDNVRALGVVADASGRGSVIVSVDGQAPKVYRVGDTLDGRTVSAIRPDEVELEAGGARQVFRLPPARASAPGLTIVGSAAGVPTTPSYLPEVRIQAPPSMSPPLPMSMPPAMQQPSQGMPPGSRPDMQGLPSPRQMQQGAPRPARGLDQ